MMGTTKYSSRNVIYIAMYMIYLNKILQSKIWFYDISTILSNVNTFYFITLQQL